MVVDPLFVGGRVVERCVRRVRTYGQTLSCQLTLGEVERDLHAMVQDVDQRLGEVEGTVADVADEVFPPAVDPEPGPGPDEPDEPEPGPGPGPDEPDEPVAEVAPRALLPADGTLEFTYLPSEASPSGVAVDGVFEAHGGYETLSKVPWHEHMKDFTAVRFDASFADAGVTSLSYWFYTATKLESVSDMGVLSGIAQMDYAFCSCSSLAALDLCGFGVGDRLSLKMAFGACALLERILVDADWVLPTLTNKYATFHNCMHLVGGNGTTYANSRISGDYMRIDAEGVAGYLTAP